MDNDNLCLEYIIEEQRLTIYSKDFEEVVSMDNVRLSKNKIKKMRRHKDCAVYLDVVFKCPLELKDIDKIDVGY